MAITADYKNLQLDIETVTGLCYSGNNGYNLITLCPMCEKERYHTKRSHGHLYIGTEAPIFRCFRCQYKGIVPKLLSCFGLDFEKYYDKSIFNINWQRFSKDSFENKEINTGINLEKSKEFNIEDYLNKESYLRDRIPNYDNSDKTNIILDIKHFLKVNNIILEKDEYFLNFIYNNFVGFVSTRKSLLMCRNIDPDSKFRYFKISLKDIYFKDFFSYELNPESKTIVMCEGIFDLFNVIQHSSLKHVLDNSRIISTALNNEYVKTLISTLDYVKLTHVDVIILSDKDVTEDKYMNIFYNNAVKSLTLYYNSEDKDFGTGNINPVKVPIKKYFKRKN